MVSVSGGSINRLAPLEFEYRDYLCDGEKIWFDILQGWLQQRLSDHNQTADHSFAVEVTDLIRFNSDNLEKGN